MKRIDFEKHLDLVNDFIECNLLDSLHILILNDWRFLEDMQNIVNDEYDTEMYKREKLFKYFKDALQEMLILNPEDFDGHIDYENVFEDEDEEYED